MASNTSRSIESVVTDEIHFQQSPRRRTTSTRSHRPFTANMTEIQPLNPDPHSALFHGHDHHGLVGRVRQRVEMETDTADTDHNEESFLNKSASKRADQMITPFLAQHIPHQYNPLGGGPRPQNAPFDANTKYCYRHRPDLLCRRQADEPSMEQLQEELGSLSQADQQGIAHVWSLFSAAPSKHRNLMLQGILAQCCFPQLSFISSSVRNLIKIDFLAALPAELSFKILSYLDTASLCKAAQVSRRWRQLADDDVVWHKMCEQHIDRKCTKCGWGLPLLEQKRLRAEKRQVQLRAGLIQNGWSPKITPLAELPAPAPTLPTPESEVEAVARSKRPAEGFSSPDTSAKRTRTEELKEQETMPEQLRKRPWKEVYKDRFRVGTNWKYGRYSTKIFKGHTNGVMCLQFDEQILMTGSYDATIKIWDIETGKEIRTLIGHTAGIRCLQFDSTRLITGSLDQTVKIWNWRTGQCVRTLDGYSQGVVGLHFDDKLKILAAGSMDSTVRLHDFKSMQRVTLRGHTDWVNCVRIDSASRTLFSASDDCTVKLWDLDNILCLRSFEGHVGQVQQVLLLPPECDIDEAEFLNSNNNDHSDAASITSELAQSPQAPSEPLFPSDSERPLPPPYMITGSLDGTIRLWHVPSGRCIHRFFGHVEGIWALAADTLRLVSGAEDKTVKVWDPRTGQHERTLTGHTGPVTCVGLSDSRLVSGSEDGTVRVHCFWDDGKGGDEKKKTKSESNELEADEKMISEA